jgi:hypothetical protein
LSWYNTDLFRFQHAVFAVLTFVGALLALLWCNAMLPSLAEVVPFVNRYDYGYSGGVGGGVRDAPVPAACNEVPGAWKEVPGAWKEVQGRLDDQFGIRFFKVSIAAE